MRSIKTDNIFIKLLFFIVCGLLMDVNTIKAQQKDTVTLNKILNSMPKHTDRHLSYTDSLIARFDNCIYNTYQDYHFWEKGVKQQFTMLQISIDKYGKIKRIWYSDSADKIFVDAFLKESVSKTNISTLERYAKAKGYKNLSLLIPVYFETNFENSPTFEHNYDFMESIMKFDGKPFSGKSVILEPVIIRVLAKHNS